MNLEDTIKTLRYCSEHQYGCDGCPLKDVDIPVRFNTQCGLYAMHIAANYMQELMQKPDIVQKERM